MAEIKIPLLIKRYASRRLYNAEINEYVTLEDIVGFIRKGREAQIIGLRTGDDLTRQYLLQIVADHESKGKKVLPIEVLTDLVRSYATGFQSLVHQFLETSFDMLRNQQSKLVDNLNVFSTSLMTATNFKALRKQQEAFLKSMMIGMPACRGLAPTELQKETPTGKNSDSARVNLADIKKQLADLQAKLAKL
jgi:polyhydroxyalkanoate synthesis repressor PhaR